MFDEAGNRVGGARMTAVVTLRPGKKGKHYRLPTEGDYAAVRAAHERLAELLEAWERGGRPGLCPVPDEPLPPIGTLGFRVQRYGMLRWDELFTSRQKTALLEFCRTIETARDANQTVAYLLALTLGKVADFNCSLARWRPSNEDVGNLFGRQAIPLTWDFVETGPTGSAYVGLERATAHVVDVTRRLSSALTNSPGQVLPADATESPLPDSVASVWFTDPPYYDAIPYADLSDFFLVWLKRSLPEDPLLRNPFDPDDPLTPKEREAVQDQTKQVGGRPKNREWFEETMAKAFGEGRRVLQAEGVGAVVFAHKTTEGWEALLSGMIRGGWTITGSWPISTEMASRLRSRNSAALATSIHLVCRPRPDDAPVGDWMERLQDEGIRGADLVFACIGPALEIFSRYSRVETADGGDVGLPAYLEKVWEVVGRTALENVLGAAEAKARNGLAGALEEDARLTALFLWTLQTSSAAEAGDSARGGGRAQQTDDEPTGVGAKGYSLPFDVARRFAQPLGIDLPKWEKRIVETKKGVVRLLPVSERAKRLFGEDGSAAMAKALEQPDGPQRDLFAGTEVQVGELAQTRGGFGSSSDGPGDRAAPEEGATTLDRVHTAMLLQAGGRTHALRNLVTAERERGPDFERLANALSALYPRGSEEKRLLDAMLLASPS